ncbi:ABC transporter ATP-binding protein [Candidatus Peregrinibacteria bacterium]|nr:MAG: ABC transporter ATP-binding protein [Candidatus Peregrinibacteria bacterium]
MPYKTRQLIADLWTYIQPYKQRFFAGSFLRISSDVIWLYPPWALSQIINFATTYESGQSLQEFWMLWASVCILAVYHYLTHDGAKYLIYQLSERMRLDAIQKAVRHIFKLDPDWHEKENSGNKIQRIHKAGESLDQMMRLYVDLCIESTINVIGITIVLLTMGTWVGGIMLLFFLTYYLISRKMMHRASQRSLECNVEWEQYEGVLFESVNNIATIRSLGFWKPIMAWLQRRSVTLYATIRRRIFWYRTRSATLNLWREAFRQCLIWYVVFQVLQGHLEVGSIALVLLYFQKSPIPPVNFRKWPINSNWAALP